MNKGGFTLIELVMVIVIIGILAIVAIPRYFNLQTEARNAAEAGVVGGVRGGIHTYFAANRDWPASLESSILDGEAFDVVLTDPIAAPGGADNWSDASGTSGIVTYTGPSGATYTYTPTGSGAGTFK